MNPYFRVPILAFYSSALYRSVAREWRGFSILYLLGLLFFCWFLNATSFYIQLVGLKNEPELHTFLDQIPPISIQDGEVSTEVSQPYFITEESSPGVFFIIDTTGEITTLDHTVTEGVLLTKDRLLVKRAHHNDLQELDLSQVRSFTLNREIILDWLGPFALVMSLAVLLFMPFLALAYRLTISLLLSAVGQAAAQGVGAPLEWAACFRLAVVAMSPGILISTIIPLLIPGAFIGSGWWLAFGGLNVGYMAFGILANRMPSGPLPTNGQ